MPTYTVNGDQFPNMLEVHELRRQRTIVRGFRLAAERARVEAIKATPVDQGEARRGWEVVKVGTDEVQLRNDTIHAEILELGRRPGRTAPPLAPILEWVYRHSDELGVGNARSDLASRQTIGVGHSIIKGRYKKREFWEVEDVEADAKSMAFRIQQHIAENGSKPMLIIGSRLELFAQWAQDEVRELLEAAG